MEKNQTPNLFNYATSELSHDALIAWLLSWADPAFEDDPLHSFSRSVLSDFFELTDKKLSGVQRVEVKTQYRNIDVLILVTDQSGKQWAVIVENKMHTREHSDQLNRYRENIHKDEKLEDITDTQILGIYYKMWEQSDMRRVNKSEFSHFGRKHMLRLLDEKYETGTSDIVDQYQVYLEKMQENLDAYKTKQVKDWTGTQWTGFYSKLKQDLNDGDFGYVPNPSGGFMGYWFGYENIGGESSLYLQSEQSKFCFKIHIKEKERRKAARNFWHRAVIEAGTEAGLEVVKPRVMRTGRWFTIGVIKTPKDQPWMSIGENGELNYSETLNKVRNALDVISIAARKKDEWGKLESAQTGGSLRQK